MAKKVNVLAELLKCALFGEQVSEYVKERVTENAKLLYDVSSRHDIVHLVEYAFQKSDITIADEALAYDFLRMQVMSVMRYENQKDALVNISQLFENEKIPFIPLKGSVIRDFYPEPWMRTSCDIDILVRKEDLERARDAIVGKLGFTLDKKQRYHDVSLYLGDDVHLELHFSIKENMDNVDKLLERVWEYATPKCDDSYEYVLKEEFFMFHTIAHMTYHFLGGGCGIRSYVDLHILKQKMKCDEQKFREMLKMCGIEKFYEASLALIDVWFSDAEHDDVTRSMHKYLLVGGAYGEKTTAIAISKGDKSKFKYLVQRVFQPYSKLVITYPNLKNKPFLTPFYQVRRWFRVLSNGRIKDSAQELAVIGKLDDSRNESLASLFKKVGLK